MKRQEKLAQILNIEPGEGRLVGLLYLLYFFLGAAYSFTQAAAFPIFLLTFSSRDLPWIYMSSAVVVTGITIGYLRLGKRLSFSTLLSGTILFLFLVIFAFRFGLILPANRWVIFGMPILFQVLINFGNLTFWSLAGRLLHVRQAKRLFGLVGGGQWAAIFITGFLIPILVPRIGTANLFVLAAASIALVFLILTTLTRAFSSLLKAPEADASRSVTRQAAQPASNRYVFLIFALVLFWWVAYFFIDNIFYGQLAIRYANEEQLAGFIGFYLAGQSFLILLMNTLLAGPIINRFGLRRSLLILPVGLIAVTVVGVLLGSFPGLVGLLFVLAVLSKLMNMALGFSVDLSSQNVLYQPLPAQQRLRTKTLADGVVQPVGGGLAGLTLLVLTTGLAFGMIQLDYILLIILAGWIAVVIFLNREYPFMIRKALTRQHLKDISLEMPDETSVSVLIRELQNPQPGIVLYALNVLETAAPVTLRSVISSVLVHPSLEVRREALETVEHLHMTSARGTVLKLILGDPIPEVRGTALRVLSALGGEDIFALLEPYIHDPDPQLKMGALLGLMRNGGIQGILAAGNSLLEMSKADSSQQRRLAAQIIGQLNISSFYDPLIPLLKDERREVRREAIRSAGQLRNPKLTPLVVEALQDPALHRTATTVLVAWGEGVLPVLFSRLRNPDQNHENQVGMIDIIGCIGGVQAMAWLKYRLSDPSAPVRTQVLQSLRQCSYQAVEDEKDLVQDQIKTEAAQATKILSLIFSIAADKYVSDKDVYDRADHLFLDSLQDILDQVKNRIFDLLSFLYDPATIQDARLNLALSHASNRAYALEVLEVVVSQPIKGWVYPLWTEATAEQKIQQLKDHFPSNRMSLEHCLREVLSEQDGRYSVYCQACALHTIGVHSLGTLMDFVRGALRSPHPLLRETAAWTISKLEAIPDEPIAHPLGQDHPVPENPKTGQPGQIDRSEGELAMLTTLEKVIALKKSSIFTSLPNDILTAVATLLEESWFEEGSMIVEKGKVGDCMYIIMQGKVRVHDGDHTLNFLEEGNIFGEMAVLDSEPRVASVTAVADTRLLRLAQEPLYELIDEQPDLARGIIRTLSGHLRARIQDLNVLKAGITEQKEQHIS
jgi:HEAT repeat protein